MASSSSCSSSSSIRPRMREPVSIEYDWQPSTFDFDPRKLPPLPAIKDPSLASQARTSKNFAGWPHGRTQFFTHGDELESYRRLEWLGDARLSSVFTLELFRRFPALASGSLTKLRGLFVANYIHAYLARAFGLDLILLEPPRPRTPPAGWRPLSASQNIIADLLQAHFGALVLEGRDEEVVRWVRDWLDAEREKVKKVADELGMDAEASRKITRPEKSKRAQQAATFEGGRETDPVTNQRRHSFLADCPASTMHKTSDPSSSFLRTSWDDRPDLQGGWHSHLIVDGKATVGCGRAPKMQTSRNVAVETFFRLARLDEARVRFLGGGELPAGGRDLTTIDETVEEEDLPSLNTSEQPAPSSAPQPLPAGSPSARPAASPPPLSQRPAHPHKRPLDDADFNSAPPPSVSSSPATFAPSELSASACQAPCHKPPTMKLRRIEW